MLALRSVPSARVEQHNEHADQRHGGSNPIAALAPSTERPQAKLNCTRLLAC